MTWKKHLDWQWMDKDKFYLVSKIISVLGLVIFGLGLILNKNLYLIVWGILMILLGLVWFWKS
jgi:hypothetical protein